MSTSDLDIESALSGLPGWRLHQQMLEAAYVAGTAAAALELIAAIGRAAEAANHHPDVDWRYDKVFIRSTTHHAGNVVTGKDIALAQTIADLAHEAGVQPLASGTSSDDVSCGCEVPGS